MIERNFDIPFIADLALREKQIQQNYRQVIAVHKWFARRPGTLFRALLLSEFAQLPLREAFYKSHIFKSLRIADPFMGGGIPLIEANRLGCNVIRYDINPMSYWVVEQEIKHIDLERYRETAQRLRSLLEKDIGHLYRTKRTECGNEYAQVKYFLWVKTKACTKCGKEISLFPGYLLAQNKRHPKNVFICSKCGNLTETDDRENPGNCGTCGSPLLISGPAKRNRCICPHCGAANTYPDYETGAPKHRLFAIEYHCPRCRPSHRGRFFKKPDSREIELYRKAESRLNQIMLKFVPDDFIPEGDETNRLLRWGYRQYKDMFNSRQLLGLELSCKIIQQETDERIRAALATNLSDLLRYQNMLCRYDKMALKSLDIFSVHGYPVGLIQCESNLLGIDSSRKGVSIGSGGWSNIIDKFTKAKSYCDKPYELLHRGKRKQTIPMQKEWIGDKNGSVPRGLKLSCSDASDKRLPPATLDGVFTDPPFELTVAELAARLEEMVDVTISDLGSEFLLLPEGPAFIKYEGFRAAYEVLKRHAYTHT